MHFYFLLNTYQFEHMKLLKLLSQLAIFTLLPFWFMQGWFTGEDVKLPPLQ